MLYLQAGIEVWCNGSTTDFGSVCPGSNPGTSTFFTGHIPEPLRPQGPFQFCRGKIPAPGGPLMRTSYTGHIPEPLRRSSRFPTLRCKVPRPRRCSDEHFIVKPFSSISAGRLRCFDVCDISLTLRRAACAAPAGVAFQFCRGKIPRPRRCSDEHFIVKPFSSISAGRLRCLRSFKKSFIFV